MDMRPLGIRRQWSSWCLASRLTWHGVLGASGRRGAGLALSLTTLLGSATGHAEWPPPEQTPIVQLSTRLFWPNDPGYAPSSEALGEHSGQWWLYSFVPERDPAAFLLRQPFLASGLSVDAAWRYGTGSAFVLLAFIDDGIDWGEAQLSASLALNPGELQIVPPLHSDGSPCARLAPADPTSPRLDCATPADGMLTVQDFRESLGWFGDIIGHDPNGNGILDPEDIVSLYSNNVDDDGNGLVDDIAGWNFAEGNYDLRHRASSHGTEVALDVLAPINDAKGRAGVCPACLGLPIRVAEQRGSDPQSLALAILYAASRGATAALVGHLPVGRSETLETAIRIAAQRGMLVLFPLDGEHQRYPLTRFNFETWLPVGALTTHNDDNRTDRTISFASVDSSQALAPGVNLMGSGPTRSRRAQSVVLGITGLVSASSMGATGSRLTPLELASVLRGSADPIDPSLTSLTESPSPDAPSLRRVNANAAVEAVRARLIPPEVELDRPTWYEPIVEEKAASLTVTGRVSARRARSLDIQISMAVGGEPTEVNFQPVFRRDGLDPQALSGAGSTIATLDPRTFRQTVDGSSQQSSAVITIRVKATSHYADVQEEVSAEVQRGIVLLRDPDLILGTPLRVGPNPTSPKLADIDGDSVDDIVFGDLDGTLSILAARDGRLGSLHSPAIRSNELEGFRQIRSATVASPILDTSPSLPDSLGHSPIVAPPAVADLDGNGTLEVVAASLDGSLYAYQQDGSLLPGWSELALPDVTSDCTKNPASCSARLERGVSSSPVIADVNGDGHPEVIVAAHDGKVHAYLANGQPAKGWPVAIGVGATMQPGRLTQSPAVADFNFDRIDDLVITAGEERTSEFGRGTHYLLLGHQDGPEFADGWPVGVATIDATADRIDRSTPPAAIDSSGTYARALLYGNSSQPFFSPLNPGATQETDGTRVGQLPENAEPVSLLDNRPGFRLSDFGALSEFKGTTIFSPMLARPSIGDLDRDNVPDVVVPGITLQSLYALQDNSRAEHQALLGLFSGKTGQMLPIAPIPLGGFVGANSAAIADLSGDGYPEVVATNGSGGILALDVCGRSATHWPKVVGGSVSTTPAVGDVDGNGTLDVVVTTDDGWLYVWQTQAKVDGSYIPWASAQNDKGNRSNYQLSPADNGKGALDTSEHCAASEQVPVKVTEPHQLSARGGCSCSIGRASTFGEWIPLLHGALVLVGMQRRRRRTPRRS